MSRIELQARTEPGHGSRSRVSTAAGARVQGIVGLVVLTALSSNCLFFGKKQEEPAQTQAQQAQASALPSPAEFDCPGFAQDPLPYFRQQHLKPAVICGQDLLGPPARVAPEQMKDILITLGMFYTAENPPKVDAARTSCLAILTPDPYVELGHPDDELSYQFVELFTRVQNELKRQSPRPPDIRSLAIGEISTSVPKKGKFEVSEFAEGLRYSITRDFMQGTSLKVVERTKLRVIMDEVQMSNSGQVVNPEYAVPLGRLTGAQSFVFGHLTGVGNEFSLSLRWVDTATSEIIAVEEGKKVVNSTRDLEELKRMVLERLIPVVHEKLSGIPHLDGAIGLPKRENYLQAVLKSGAAILAERRGDDAAAQILWAEVHALNPDDRIAGVRARVLAETAAIASMVPRADEARRGQ